MTFGEFRFRCSKLYPGIDLDILDGYINDRIQKILDRRAWTGLVADGTFTTVGAYQTGTVSLTQGSAAVTGTGTTFTSGMTGRKFRAIAGAESYTFTYVSSTTGTLDRVFEGTTDATASYIIYEDTYDLPDDFKRPVVSRNERIETEIVHWTRQQLDRVAPSRQISGEPQIYCMAPNAADGTRRAQLYPIPAYAASYPFSYIMTFARFGTGDTSIEIPDWISIGMLNDFVKADVKGDAAAEAKGEAELLRMTTRDVNLEGPKKLRIAPAHARHRLERTTRFLHRGIRM